MTDRKSFLTYLGFIGTVITLAAKELCLLAHINHDSPLEATTNLFGPELMGYICHSHPAQFTRLSALYCNASSPRATLTQRPVQVYRRI